MSLAEKYLSTPAWREVRTELVLGRPVQVYAERLRNVTDLLEISSARDDQVLLVHGDRRVRFGEFVPATLTGAGGSSGSASSRGSGS